MSDKDALIAQATMVLNSLLEDAGIQKKIVLVTNSGSIISVMTRDTAPVVTERVYMTPEAIPMPQDASQEQLQQWAAEGDEYSKLELDEQQRRLDEQLLAKQKKICAAIMNGSQIGCERQELDHLVHRTPAGIEFRHCGAKWAGRHCVVKGRHHEHLVPRLDGTGDHVWEV